MGNGKIYPFILDCSKSRMDAISTFAAKGGKEYVTNKLAVRMGRKPSVNPKQINKEESKKNIKQARQREYKS